MGVLPLRNGLHYNRPLFHRQLAVLSLSAAVYPYRVFEALDGLLQLGGFFWAEEFALQVLGNLVVLLIQILNDVFIAGDLLDSRVVELPAEFGCELSKSKKLVLLQLLRLNRELKVFALECLGVEDHQVRLALKMEPKSGEIVASLHISLQVVRLHLRLGHLL